MPLAAGSRLGPYEIIGPLGAGGMGEVYRAHDVRLDRDVAVKVLPEHLAGNPEFRARFLREAKAVAALSHPNILTIHDFGLDRDACYSVTELLEGQTVRALLERSPLPWRRALDYGVMLAEGLSAAHAKGIIHRDLKPENIFLTADGQLKILDFGLARFESAEIATAELSASTVTDLSLGQTQAGKVMGTLGYMSPEQVRGEKLQPTTDIFSLGCVLYEMLTQRPAFAHRGWNVTFAASANSTPLDVRDLETAVPPPAANLVARCLEKQPEARYQSARDLAFQLRQILNSSEIRKRGGAIPSVAVLPFVSSRHDEDSDYLCDGVTESIINNLSSIPKLHVAARSLVFRYKGKDVDCLAAARDLNVDAILSGRLVRRGDRLQIQADLTDAARGSQLWGQKFNRQMAGIFEVEEEIGREIAEALRLQLTGKEAEQLAKHYTQSSAAYQCYLKGRYYWAKRSREALTRSLEEFSRAIALDRNYALAYCGLADTYGMLSMYRFAPPQDLAPQALAAARTAIEIDSKLAEAHTSWAFWTMNYEWNWTASETAFQRAIELNPRYSNARQWYSAHLLCRGRFDEALASAEAALQLEPLSLSANSSLGWLLHFSRRYDDAIAQYRKTIEIDPYFFLTYHFLALSYEQKGMYDEAIDACEQVAKMPGGQEMVSGSLVHTYAKSGQRKKARESLEELTGRRRNSYVPAHDLAIIHSALDDKDQALAWLAEACNERSSWVTLLRLDPRLDILRDDPRFDALLRRVGLTSSFSAASDMPWNLNG